MPKESKKSLKTLKESKKKKKNLKERKTMVKGSKKNAERKWQLRAIVLKAF